MDGLATCVSPLVVAIYSLKKKKMDKGLFSFCENPLSVKDFNPLSCVVNTPAAYSPFLLISLS